MKTGFTTTEVLDVVEGVEYALPILEAHGIRVASSIPN